MKKMLIYLLITVPLSAMVEEPTETAWEKIPIELKTYIIQLLTQEPNLEQAIANLKKARRINKQIKEIIQDKTNVINIITLLSNNPKYKKSKIYIAAALNLPESLEILKEEIDKIPEKVKPLVLWFYLQQIKKDKSKLSEIVKKNLLETFDKKESEIIKLKNPLFKAVSEGKKDLVQEILNFIEKNFVQAEKAELVTQSFLKYADFATNILLEAIETRNIEIVKSILEFAKQNLTKLDIDKLFQVKVGTRRFGPSALEKASTLKFPEIVNLLKEYGAK